MSRVSVLGNSADIIDDPNVKKDDGEFTFPNGDTYVGGYVIDKDKRLLSRHGRGIYVTEDFNKYDGYWAEDRIIGEVILCHNNGTRYEGTLDTDGSMSGFGSFIFIDNSILQTIWDRNKPVADVTLKEPRGSIWRGVYDGKNVVFNAGNHFWDEITSTAPIDRGSEEEDETELDIGPNES